MKHEQDLFAHHAFYSKNIYTFTHLDEFRSKVACENDVIQLMCNPYSRIAIYGATYGKTGDESLQCQQPSQTSKDDCEFLMMIIF